MVTAKVGNGVMNAQAGTDIVKWQVLKAADGSRCSLYLTFSKGGNASYGGFVYHPGSPDDKADAYLAPDQHGETADYTLGCDLNGSRHWATPGTITVQ